MPLTVLFSRINAVKAILADWEQFTRLKRADGPRVTNFDLDPRDAQQRIERARMNGEQPNPADELIRDPAWGKMIAQYAGHVCEEHRQALRLKVGSVDGHVDAIAAWVLVARAGNDVRSTRGLLDKTVAIAYLRSEKVILETRAAIKVARRVQRGN